jgi:hypothetical protein
VTITNNTFENIGYGNDERYPLFASPLLRPEQRLGDKKYHHNIRFTNNRIKSFNGHLVCARTVKGLKVTGNVIRLSHDYPTGSDRASVELEYCEDVIFEGNTYTGFDWPVKIQSSENTTGLSVKNNKGISKE